MWKEHSGKNTGWLASGFGRKNDTERGRLYTAERKREKEISKKYPDGIPRSFKFIFAKNENRDISV